MTQRVVNMVDIIARVIGTRMRKRACSTEPVLALSFRSDVAPVTRQLESLQVAL